MAVGAPALTTRANLKSALQIATADTTYDTLIDSIIDRATEWIEGRTERKLKSRRYNNAGSTHATTGVTDEDYVYFSGTTKGCGGDTLIDEGTGQGLFFLPAWPVRSNTETGSVTYVLAVLTGRTSSGETWDATQLVEWVDYVVDRDAGVLRLLGGGFTPDYRNYRVTMAAGYLTSSAPYVPADLEQLCIAVARKMFRNDYGLTDERIGTWSRSYSEEKQDAFIESAIARYRRFSL